MYFYLVAFGLMAHVLFWGAGLAIWTMPPRWRKFWPVLAVPAGFTLQALVVWVGSLAGLKGTNSYAWWSEAVPLAVLLAPAGYQFSWSWTAGRLFANGIYVCNSSTDVTKTIGSADCLFDINYRG